MPLLRQMSRSISKTIKNPAMMITRPVPSAHKKTLRHKRKKAARTVIACTIARSRPVTITAAWRLTLTFRPSASLTQRLSASSRSASRKRPSARKRSAGRKRRPNCANRDN